MVITYDIYHHYNRDPQTDKVYGEKYKTVTTSSPEIILPLAEANRLYVGACFSGGCKVVRIELEPGDTQVRQIAL